MVMPCIPFPIDCSFWMLLMWLCVCDGVFMHAVLWLWLCVACAFERGVGQRHWLTQPLNLCPSTVFIQCLGRPWDMMLGRSGAWMCLFWSVMLLLWCMHDPSYGFIVWMNLSHPWEHCGWRREKRLVATYIFTYSVRMANLFRVRVELLHFLWFIYCSNVYGNAQWVTVFAWGPLSASIHTG